MLILFKLLALTPFGDFISMHSRLERLELLFRGHLLTLLGLQAGVVGFREHLGTIFLRPHPICLSFSD